MAAINGCDKNAGQPKTAADGDKGDNRDTGQPYTAADGDKGTIGTRGEC